MFVIECLDHVCANSCRAGVMYAKYYDCRVDTEVTSRNIQRCIICTEITKGGKGIGDSAEACGNTL